ARRRCKPPDRRGWSLYTGHPFVSRVSPVLEALVAPSYGCFEPLLASDLAEFLTLRRLRHGREAEHLLPIFNVAQETTHIIGAIDRLLVLLHGNGGKRCHTQANLLGFIHELFGFYHTIDETHAKCLGRAHALTQ